MTPCERLRYKVGDKFEVVANPVPYCESFKIGTVITLKDDDGSRMPGFTGDHPDGDGYGFCSIDRIKPVSKRATKPINKSKRQLARLLIEAGVKQFPEGANWAAQDESWNRQAKCAMFYRGADKPEVCKGDTAWRPFGDDSSLLHNVEPVALASLIPNWHQTVLSRDEFDQIVADTAVRSEQDADGWVDWNGGDCPVDGDVIVDVKTRDGEIESDPAYFWNWSHEQCLCIQHRQIISYRLHKPDQAEPQYCESVTRSIPEPVTPTLDQLLQDWCNAGDYAQRKQVEADEAAAMRDERWQAVQARAGEMGVTVGRCESVVESEPERECEIHDRCVVVVSPDDIDWEGRECTLIRIDKTDKRLPYRVRDEEGDTYWVGGIRRRP